MSLVLFNPSIATENVGDLIIIDAVVRELKAIFPDEPIISLPTQDILGRFSKQVSFKARHRVVGGTNLLSSHMLRYRQWKIGLLDSIKINDVVLMGVGWWQYQNSPDIYTKTLLRRVLSSEKMHSVRDQYTKEKLASIGINNVINTGCPTMWGLTPEHCAKIPATKSDNVVFTLTDYKKNPKCDKAFIQLLKKHYGRLYFWPQGSGDFKYFEEINPGGVDIIPPTLDAFNLLLERDSSLDFVGTRLHGGVRAIQRLRRTLILAVDNRALEIAKDTLLPVVDRADFSAIEHWIENPSSLKLRMNFSEINKWRNQALFG